MGTLTPENTQAILSRGGEPMAETQTFLHASFLIRDPDGNMVEP